MKPPERIWTCNETRNIWINEKQGDTTEYVLATTHAATLADLDAVSDSAALVVQANEALRVHISTIEDENERLRVMMTTAHAVMRACGWHLALAGEISGDGVIEAAVGEVEADFADALQDKGEGDDN